MEYRKLGRSDIDVSLICLGTMTWGEQNTEADAHDQLDYALDHEVNFIDTAEIYADGPKTDWELNPYEMRIGKESVGTSYEIKLARGGGHAVRFKHEDSE